MRLGPELLSADLYGLLELPETASCDQIKRAWRRLAIQSHPDLVAGGRHAAEQRMAQINVAASVLLDPELRRTYDRHRRLEKNGPFWPPAQEPEPQPEWEPPPRRRSFFPSAELAGLLAKLRPVSGRLLLELSELLQAWPPRKHVTALGVCVVLALSLIFHARPRSLSFLHDKPPALGVASPKGV